MNRDIEIKNEGSFQSIQDCSRQHINSSNFNQSFFEHSKTLMYQRLMELEKKWSEFESFMGSFTNSLPKDPEFSDELSKIERSQCFIGSEHSLIRNLRESIDSFVENCLTTSFAKKGGPQIEED